jgi:hypothetical protein
VIEPRGSSWRELEVLKKPAQGFEKSRGECADEWRHFSRIDGFSNRHRIGQHEPDCGARDDYRKYANQPHYAEAQAAEGVLSRTGGHQFAQRDLTPWTLRPFHRFRRKNLAR